MSGILSREVGGKVLVVCAGGTPAVRTEAEKTLGGRSALGLRVSFPGMAPLTCL